jgi:hypothetical protein
VWTGEWFGVVIHNWTFCTCAWLVQMSSDIHFVSLCQSRRGEVVNIVGYCRVVVNDNHSLTHIVLFLLISVVQ